MKSFFKYASILTSGLAIIISQVVTVEATTKCATLTVPSKGVEWKHVLTMDGNPKTENRYQALRDAFYFENLGIASFQANINDFDKKIIQFSQPKVGDLQFRFEWILTTGGPYNYWLNSGDDCSIDGNLPFPYNHVKAVKVYKRV